jgi:hypothetical protein
MASGRAIALPPRSEQMPSDDSCRAPISRFLGSGVDATVLGDSFRRARPAPAGNLGTTPPGTRCRWPDKMTGMMARIHQFDPACHPGRLGPIVHFVDFLFQFGRSVGEYELDHVSARLFW